MARRRRDLDDEYQLEGRRSPRPPRPRNVIEYVVEVFTFTVAAMMLILLVGLLILTFFRPNNNYAGAFNALTDIMTTMLGALIGYIAGKGSRSDEESSLPPIPPPRVPRPPAMPEEVDEP